MWNFSPFSFCVFSFLYFGFSLVNGIIPLDLQEELPAGVLKNCFNFCGLSLCSDSGDVTAFAPKRIVITKREAFLHTKK